jgi:UDP-glucose 4-epimerase
MKKILVTGGVGFIGTNLLMELKKLNYQLYSLDNYSTGAKKNEVEGITYLNQDITQIANLKNDFEICFHLAAQSRVQPSFDNPEESFRVNVLGTLKVMEWSRINNTKIIYAGSSSKHHNPSDSPYAMYKYLGEEVCKLYRKSYKVNVEIARFYNVYGPGENVDEKYGNVIGIWRAKIEKGEPLPIVGDGKQKRDFIHVYDIVDGLQKIAFSNLNHDDAWELGTGVNYSITNVYDFFNNYFKTDFINIPDQPGNYRTTLRENDDTLKLLNWIPKDRLEKHIKSLKT